MDSLLNLTDCRMLNDWNPGSSNTFINNIWSLLKLTYCQLDIHDVYSIVLTVISSTLEILTIKTMRCNLRFIVFVIPPFQSLRQGTITIIYRFLFHY